MPLLAFALIIVAAFLHAGWNLFAKVSKNTVALMWWATVFGTLGYGVWLASGPGIYIGSGSWLPFLVSAVCETGYFFTLVQGYSKGDLSLVYPISRGSAPIFAALWSAVLLGEQLPWSGYLGVGLMVAGVYVASLPIERSRTKFELTGSFRNSAVGWALASGIFISIYSLSDKVAVVATPPLIYNWWVFAGNTILWMPIVWRKFRFRANFEELRNNWSRIIPTGAMMMGSYGAALAALALTSASYVVAGRGLSVVIGALLGSFMLREGFGFTRITGAILMVTGLGLIAFA
jgi:drug/metabolite transporter (DMT)-like permease